MRNKGVASIRSASMAVAGALLALTLFPTPTPAAPPVSTSALSAPAAPSAPATSSPAPPAPEADEPTVSLNLPDNVELKVLVDYVSQRLDLNIVYQPELLANQRVTIRSPRKLAVKALPALLQSLLRSHGLALVAGDAPGWQRIVPLASAAKFAARGSAVTPGEAAAAPDEPATQVFPLLRADPARVEATVKPFLSGPAASAVASAEPRLVVVTDYASSLSRIAELIHRLDEPGPAPAVQFVPVHHADPSQLAEQIKRVLSSRAKATPAPGAAGESLEVTADKRTGQLIVSGSDEQLRQVLQLVRGLDVPIDEQQSPIRFYKLANATAADVLDTIRSLAGEPDESGAGPSGGALGAGAGRSTGASAGQSASLGGAAPGGAFVRRATDSAAIPSTPLGGGAGQSLGGGLAPGGGIGGGIGIGAGVAGPGGAASAGAGPGSQTPAAPAALHAANATVAADVNTNTIIVAADPPVQRLYAQLIRQLDKRRPQVLIECTIVTLDTSHNYSLGVELGAHGPPGSQNQLITFSNFGLSTPDPTTGQLTLIPGMGLNGALVNSKLAEVIVQALAADSHSRITSAPRILVNDNATGTLSSQDEFPTTATNIANTIATTSFSDYATAGTQIVLTPHISEADYLQLEYSVILSSFTGVANQANGIPPPKQEDSVSSKVTVPNGSTVIIGGLNRTTYNNVVNRVPFLGDIPILKYLFQSQTRNSENITLFVFLRPVILRDDQFEDLKFISERDVKNASLPSDWPVSEPLAVH